MQIKGIEVETLDSGIKIVRNVSRYNIGAGSLCELKGVLDSRRAMPEGKGVVYFVDHFFRNHSDLHSQIGFMDGDALEFIDTNLEPTTDGVDSLLLRLKGRGFSNPVALVGMGGGITMDITKAVSNLLTNGGIASQYQGWDLVREPGVFKIGVPTISGTGAEATRTCVMINPKTGLKLGMNSDFTVFDYVILDPNLTATVPRDQYFYTGMDAYIHCIEALSGRYRNAIGDAYSKGTIDLCKQVFLDENMQSPINRERLMVASYLGGCSIATSYVGLIHPLSAGLSVVLGIHHCLANCIVMRAMANFYPVAFDEFWRMADLQEIIIPKGVCSNLNDDDFRLLYESTIIHKKPLTNALGESYKTILTFDKVSELFKLM